MTYPPGPRDGGWQDYEGEFLHAASVVWANDSLYVLDNGNQRLSVFRPDLSLQRTAPLSTTFVYKAIATRSGGLVVNATVATADGIGFPLHLVGPGGLVERSFGSEMAALRPGFGYWVDDERFTEAGGR
jgi:hypothetical protein